MPSGFVLLQCIGKAAVKNIVNLVSFGVGGDLLVDVWDNWRRATREEQRAAEVQAVAQLTPAELRAEVARIVREEAASLPPAQQAQVASYLTQVPASIHRSLRRSSDPTGTTLATGAVFHAPEDLRPLLPASIPRFKVGDRPLPGVDWELVELLGVGGFGEVWKARNPHFDGVAPVALKFCQDERARDRLLKHEAAVLNQVMRQGKHEGIVPLLHTYLSADPPCLAYEYIDGGDLARLIQQRRGGLPPQQAAQVIHRLAEIVGFAHRLSPPIVHRDLKPANILVKSRPGSKFALRITDFGIGGLAIQEAMEQSSRGTSSGEFLASAVRAYTPLYASPQQMRGDDPDPRDDVYALGVIWYQLLIGDLRSEAPRGSAWKRRLAEHGMSRDLIALLEQCVEDHAEDRPKNAAVVANQLRSYLTGLQEPLKLEFQEGSLQPRETIPNESLAAKYRERARTVFMAEGRPKSNLTDVEYEKALADCSEAIRLNPKSAEGYLLRAKVYDYRGSESDECADLEKALADCSEAIRLDPTNVAGYLARAEIYENRSETYEKALADYNEIIRLNPTDAKGYLYRAEFYSDYGADVETIIADYTEAIRLNPTDASIYRLRAAYYAQEEYDYEKAVADYTEAIRLCPNDATAYLDRAEVHSEHAAGHEDLGAYEKAVADYTETIRLSPADSKETRSGGFILQYGHSVEHKGYLERGQIHWCFEQYEKAIADFTEAIRLNPKDASNYRCRAAVYEDMGKHDKVRTDNASFTPEGGSTATASPP